ncbi:plasmid stabilization protein [Aliarcobacter cryaerophilus]|uniref:Plasmid stabilization protein n=1 Tax=Aliarcobacter cryaerophilus TaxID=28198 RepID=A0A2S9SYC1_9BACT|nr:type II toxin-antitoxin system RelE/ParE family toxin [Aliarcobacter cryaerophilus]PRM91572.1 plasmid stabilization protein [Aliarcobacter cryaerophilus]
MKINILDEASAELDDAFQYYEYEQENLGYRFISKFTDVLELIKFYPNGWHPLSKRVRRCLVKGFPYGIIYQVREEEIIIVAVANLHRKPNYWVERIKK